MSFIFEGMLYVNVFHEVKKSMAILFFCLFFLSLPYLPDIYIVNHLAWTMTKKLRDYFLKSMFKGKVNGISSWYKTHVMLIYKYWEPFLRKGRARLNFPRTRIVRYIEISWASQYCPVDVHHLCIMVVCQIQIPNVWCTGNVGMKP